MTPKPAYPWLVLTHCLLCWSSVSWGLPFPGRWRGRGRTGDWEVGGRTGWRHYLVEADYTCMREQFPFTSAMPIELISLPTTSQSLVLDLPCKLLFPKPYWLSEISIAYDLPFRTGKAQSGDDASVSLTFFLVVLGRFVFVCLFCFRLFCYCWCCPFELKPQRKLYQGESADLVSETALMGFPPATSWNP